MNKHLYRLVFNRALGVLQAVAEIARAMRGSGRADTGRPRSGVPGALSAALVLALCALPAGAAPPGIAGDRSAPREHRPTVLAAPNGTPAINITTPSAAGVSRNAYSRFDVDARGAILNNARTRVRSEIGGWLPGNPWLAGGSARVILNEVNASEPSRLHGLVEVAGDRAQVVIANPAGIQADGAGFINANGVTLTSGRAQFAGDGSLAAYRVGGGAVEVAGQGLNAVGSGHAQLIARAVALNAALHADQATLALGDGEVAADGRASPSTAGDAGAPAFALDVGALGGMYANKIRLVGSQHGLGMRNAGVIGAQAGEVVVTLDGRIENAGLVQAASEVRMEGASIHNSGTILAGAGQAGAGASLASRGALENTGTVQASGAVRMRGATLRNDGLVNARGDQAALDASGELANHGTVQAVGEVRLSAGTLRNAGAITATEGVAVRTPGTLDNRDGRIEAPRLDLDAGALRNGDGQIVQTGQRTLALAAGQLSNRDGGRIGAPPPPEVQAPEVQEGPADAGSPVASGDAAAPAPADSPLAAQPPATPEATAEAPAAALPAGTLRVGGLLDNDGGAIEAARFGLALDGDSLDNSGGHLALESLRLSRGELRNAGGTLRIAGDSQLDVARIDNTGGELMFAATLALRAREFLNRGGRFNHAGSADARLQVDGLFDNDHGWLASNAGGLALSAARLVNTGGDVVHAGSGTLSLDAAELLGQGGRIGGNGTVALRAGQVDHRGAELGGKQFDVQAGSFDNRGGRLQASGVRASTLQVTQTLDNRDKGLVAGNGELSLSAGRFDNRGGAVEHAGTGTLSIRADTLDGVQGRLASQGTLQLRGGAIGLQQAQTFAERLDLAADSLDNRGGQLTQLGEGAARLTVRGQLANDGGSIAGNGTLSLQAGQLGNQGGTIQWLSRDPHRLQVAGLLDNREGRLLAAGALAVTAGTMDNSGGLLATFDPVAAEGEAPIAPQQSALSLAIGNGLVNRAGTVTSTGLLSLRAQKLDNREGTLAAATDAAIESRAIDNRDGTIQATDALTIGAGQRWGGVSRDRALLASTLGGGLRDRPVPLAGTDIRLAGRDAAVRGDAAPEATPSPRSIASSAGARLVAENERQPAVTIAPRAAANTGEASVDPATAPPDTLPDADPATTLDNRRGRIVGASLALDADQVDNRQGLLGTTTGELRVDSGAFDNSEGGRVQSAAALSIDTRGQALRNRNAGEAGGLRAAEALTLRSGELDNRGGVISATRAAVEASDLDNRDGGLLSAEQALSLRAAAVRNSGGKLQSSGEARLQLSGDLDNRAGLVASAGLLDLQAARIDNRDTHQPDTALGLQAGTLQLRGETLDNRTGLIVVSRPPVAGEEAEPAEAGAAPDDSRDGSAPASADAHITLGGALENAGGVVSAADTLAVSADVLNNQAGLLHAGVRQDIGVRELNGTGSLESRGDARVHVRGDLDHTGTMTANGQLTLLADGQLTQRGQLGGGAVDVQAQAIDNTASGRITSLGLTHLKAERQIRNRGLIDGGTTHLEAPAIDNLGSGRLYGDHVAISATTLRNLDETIDGRQQSATIAARRRLDLGVATLHNSGQALIYSAGDAGIGGALDEARTATGIASRVENTGATIDIAGELDLQAREVHNERQNVETSLHASAEPEVRLDQPSWRHNGKNATRDIRRTSNYEAWEVYYLDPADILEDAPYYTPDGQRIGRAVVRLTPRTSAFFFERGGLHAALGARDRLPAREGTVTIYYLVRQDGQDNPDQIDPGRRDPFAHLTTFNTPSGEKPPSFEYLDQAPEWSGDYGTCRTGCVQLSTQYQYTDPEKVLINPKGAGNKKLSGNEQYRTARRQVMEDVLVSAGPDAVLQSGGDMHLKVGRLTNLHGRVIAGGEQKIEGLDGGVPLIDNQGTKLYRTWSFDVTHHRYDGSTGKADPREPVSEQIGAIGALMGGGRRLQIEGDGLRNLDHGRDAPNVVTDLAASNLPHPGPGRTLQGNDVPRDIAPGALNAPTVVAAADGSADRVATANLDARLPTASLFQPAAPGSGWLVQTDPQFSGGHDWLSSESQLLGLGYNPADLHKRLGDGFYEQGLVRDQIIQLSGRRFLDGHASDEAQFRTLLENGATFARQFNLRPGLALTAEQMAALTSDIVWLVEQTVTLPDGSTTIALVPRVYMRLRPGDLQSGGALLTADVVKADLVGDLLNTGTVHGRQLVDLKANNLNNIGGDIKGDLVLLEAEHDINNIAGTVTAKHGLVAFAGNDINQVSTTRTDGSGGNTRTRVDRLATMTVTGPNATVLLKAGGNYNSQAGQVRNEGEGGQTAIIADGDIRLGTVRVGSREQSRAGRDSHREFHEADAGSVVVGQGDVTLQAGGNITSIASTVNSAKGTLYAEADGNITVTHGTAIDEYESSTHTNKKRTFGSKKTDTYDHVTQSTVQGSSWGGDKVVMVAKNITVDSSNVISDNGTVLKAEENVSILAGKNTLTTDHRRQVKKSGVFSDGGVGFSIGSQKLANSSEATESSHTGSVVGSVSGKTTIYAGKHVQVTASDVIGGDGVGISGATVAIEHAVDEARYLDKQKTSSGGIHVSLKGGAADQAAAAYHGAKAAGQAEDGRLKALYAVKAVNAASNVNGTAIQNQYGNAKDVVNGTEKANGSGMSLRIGVGGSSSSNQAEGHRTSSHGSRVYSANGDVVVVAREGDLAIAGSAVEGVNTTVAAARHLLLGSAQEFSEHREKNRSRSGEVGFTAGSEAGLGVYVSASGANGRGSGNGVSHQETIVGGMRGTTTFMSGKNTVMGGAQVVGHQVIGDVRGDLLMGSRQDTNEYHRKDVAAGIDAAIGTGGGSASGYVNASKVDSTYKSVREQTGIQAGDGGYHITVAGKTSLDGAAVASTADPSLNYFRTGSLQWKDIVNEAEYRAVSVSASGGTNSSSRGGTVSSGRDSGHATSTTQAGIANGTLIVDDGSGMDLTRGVTALQKDGLKEIFDQRKVAETVAFNQVASEMAHAAVADYMGARQAELERRGKTASSEERQAIQGELDELKTQQRMLNILVGAATGNAGAAVTQESLAVAADWMRRKMIESSQAFPGVTDGETTFSNISGESVGVDGDGIKLGGTRIDLDLLCGSSHERCLRNPDGSLSVTADGRAQFDAEGLNMSLNEFIATKDGRKMFGLTGGVQGLPGTLAGLQYEPGSLQDRIIEYFAGPHDMIGGQLAGLYDNHGNALRERSSLTKKFHDSWTVAAIPLAAPFAMAKALPPEVWQAITVLLRASP